MDKVQWMGDIAQNKCSLSAHRNTSQVLILVLRVFPGLREHAVVPVNVVWIETQLVLLDVLLDRI